MRNITEQEHLELVLYLETLIGQMNKWVLTQCKKGESLYDCFTYYPYLKLCNDTFSELLVNDIPL